MGADMCLTVLAPGTGSEVEEDVLRGELVEVAAGVQDDRRETTKRTLAEAWQRAAAGHTLLDGVGLPPVALSDDDLEEWAERQNVPQRRRGRHGDDRGVRRDPLDGLARRRDRRPSCDPRRHRLLIIIAAPPRRP
ncbi:hypothetical protein [Streptomyces sp. NBC_01565]|uniref:hypothetical protein n=1 Tax=Streptomyces sp. NBC_01565 TaxID=2975881 RepID=UPI0022559C4F|nr:hypothetical protein [Streptomyces sp. NBC_01565]MCX4539165.1 hypothetical protein [Streptomyces sp. NBC_01565]